ncbi:DNA cytosine methyltransferase [Actinosynnema sp. CA-248983]
MEQLTAIDLFAGAGGATAGLQHAGLAVLAAVENDVDAAASYRTNHPNVLMLEQDIRKVDPELLRRQLGLRKGSLDLLKACPPCQGFSSLAKGEIDEIRNDLVLDVIRFARSFRPRIILLENVPGLARDIRLPKLIRELEQDGYRFRQYVVDASHLGVPQRRKRLIIFGVSTAVRRDPPPTFFDLLPGEIDISPTTVRAAFSGLKRNRMKIDPLNKHRQSSPKVLARIKAVPINGTRFDLPVEHQLACHIKIESSGRRATASYGRVRLDEPAPTMTTRCTTPACGSFIHPTEHRGLTLREAAVLQTFPYDYIFVGSHESVERQIGNAVPVRMAEILGHASKTLLRSAPKRRRTITSIAS